MSSSAARIRRSSIRRSTQVAHAVTYVILVLGAIAILAPLGWQISTAFKPPQEVFLDSWIPSRLYLDNFTVSWNEPTARGFKGWMFLKNTLILALNGAAATVISSALVAYGFSRYEFPGRDILFMICLSTMMLPNIVTMIPTFVLFRTLGWLDSYKPLMIPAWFGSAYNIFLFRQFFLTIPFELEDAARIDGCADLGFFFRILMPLSWPAIATVAIFSFRWNWQNYMGPLIYINSHHKYTLQLGLTMFRSTQYMADYGAIMAVSLIIMTPPLVIFFFAQRWFIQGIVFTGIKS